jgi:3-oxoadipate enol-lactonase
MHEADWNSRDERRAHRLRRGAATGEPVVLIHAGVANLRMWDAQVEALKDRYRLIRHDTRGFGETETDAVAFSNRADIAACSTTSASRRRISWASRGAGRSGSTSRSSSRSRALADVVAGGVGGYESPAELPAETWEAVEAMWKAKEWEALSDWETAFWADGPGQPADRVPEIRRRVHGWILENYRAEKEEGEPQPLDPPAETRLGDLRAPLLVMLGTLDEPSTTDACATWRHPCRAPGSRSSNRRTWSISSIPSGSTGSSASSSTRTVRRMRPGPSAARLGRCHRTYH